MDDKILVPRSPNRRTVMVLLFLAATTFGLVGMNLSQAHAVSLPLYSISKSQSGLVASDPLNATLSQSQLSSSSFWTFGGDAAPEGVPYAYNENSSGLHIGVSSPTGEYAGYYALHTATATLAHAVISAPSSTIPNGYPDVGLYVQTTGGSIVNYVYCGPTISSSGTYWEVASVTSSPSFVYQPLYIDTAADQPLSMGCTIVTNGSNYLAVYLDGSQVYLNSELSLGYQQPLYFFLETQTSYTGGMFTGSFQDFYLTSSQTVTVTNMPSDSTAEIVSASGQLLASSAASSGAATMDIAQYSMPLVANIEVTELGAPVASTSSPIPIWGGDTYSLSLLGLGSLLSTSPSSGSSSPSVTLAVSTAVASVAGGATQATAAPSAGSVSQVGAVSSATPATTSAAVPVSTTTASPSTALTLLGVAGLVMQGNSERTASRRAKRLEMPAGQEAPN